jgi:hypothetical protein
MCRIEDMKLSAAFERGFTKMAMRYGVSPRDTAALLQKVASPLSGFAEGAGKFFNHPAAAYGIPLASGAAAGAVAHHEGADVPLSAAVGLGATQLTSPRRWGEIANEARQAHDPFTSFSRQALKDLSIKAAIPAGVGALETVPKILSNVKDTTGNTAQITGDAAKQAPNLLNNLNRTVAGSGDFFDPKTGQLPQIAGAAKDVANTLKTEVPKLTSAATNIGNDASAMMGNVASIPAGINRLGNQMMHSYDGMSTGQKVGLGAGAAGLGALGLAKLMSKKDQKPRRTEIIEY